MITPRAQGQPLRPWPPEPTPPGPMPPGPGPVPPFPPGPPPRPGRTPEPARPAQNPAMAPVRVWIDPRGWPGHLYDRLLDRRIVMAHGHLDGEAATRLAAQLLTLDAEGTAPIRLELQNLSADLPAALSVMGILDVVRGPVSGYAGGRVEGPALGILAACRHRMAYPNALFVLSEPQVSFDGTVTALASREEQARAMLDELFGRGRRGHRARRGPGARRRPQGHSVQCRRGDRVRPGGKPGHGASPTWAPWARTSAAAGR